MRLGIVVPVLNEAQGIAICLQTLQTFRADGHEVIVVDGGSTDTTLALAAPLCDQAITAPSGRANQMNAGAALCKADVLLFLHADTLLPKSAVADICQALAQGAVWGRFDVSIQGRSLFLPLIATMMNLRSRWTGIATGDQALFVRRAVFETLGGFASQPLMEDLELSARLRDLGWPACIKSRVQTSGRRWDQKGAMRTVWLMWCLRWRYWRGESPEALARAYQ